MSESPQARLHAVVEGRVQGVGFRAFVLERALKLGLTGWVRNRWDGTVEVLAEGQKPDLEKLITNLNRGPHAYTTSNVHSEWLPATGEFTRFQVRMTSG
jgi:acylphosphatase